MNNSDPTKSADSDLCYICQMVQSVPVGIWTWLLTSFLSQGKGV